MLLIQTVIITEATLQTRFLEKRDVNQVQQYEENQPAGQRNGTHKNCLSQEDTEDATDHGIAHIPIDAANDKLPGWVPWRKRTLSNRRKQ